MTLLRLLLVDPGASTSTADVFTGLKTALARRPELAVEEYNLSGRIVIQSQTLGHLFKAARRRDPSCPEPTPDDVILRATRDLPWALWRHSADWLVIVSGMFVHPDYLALLKWYGFTNVALLLTESPYDDDRQLRLLPFCRLAWTNERTSVTALANPHSAIRYLPHAYNPAVHYQAPPLEETPAHDVVFVGTGFQERIEILAAVPWATLGIDLGLYGNWDYLGGRHRLRRYVRGEEVSNEFATSLYRKAKIGLNLHRQSMGWGKDAPRVAAAESLNPRAYELAACGCFTISDARAEVAERFGDLVPTFQDPAELGPLLVRWLADEAGRARMTAALPEAVAAESWDTRAAQVSRDLQAVTEGVEVAA